MQVWQVNPQLSGYLDFENLIWWKLTDFHFLRLCEGGSAHVTQSPGAPNEPLTASDPYATETGIGERDNDIIMWTAVFVAVVGDTNNKNSFFKDF